MAFLAIALYAHSYRSLPETSYYQYHFGRGGTGHLVLNLKQFERYCTLAWTAKATENLIKRHGAVEKYQALLEQNRRELFNDCIQRWFTELRNEDKGPAFDLMLQYWDAGKVIAKMAQKLWLQRAQTSNWLLGSQSLVYDRRPIRTIGAYYHSCVNGGAQRVFCTLCQLWADMGYKVVVFTDELPSVDDYPLPDGVTRVILSHFQQIKKETFISRFSCWKQAIEEHHIDAVVYHAYASHMLFGDELSIKSLGAAFLIHCHNVFSIGMLRAWPN